ncbi:MAG: hypothetical protein GEU86_04900 [Actinophytocola sp.]|nr:hypothetical protein [Actinophytocola sp.]
MLLVPTTLVALAEGFLREFFGLLALLACVGAIFSGVTSGQLGWATGAVLAGIAGAVLVLVALIRRWSFGRQWGVYVGVLLVEGGLIAAVENLTP